ncbi:hypothetical protein D3797_004755 [Bacillus subtilis]|nr:hypothetical protein DKG76_17160 [Bacillus inaquosorum]RKQ25409.1 hypothetical protein D3797_004755 [Bacillus subtilis]
MLKTLPVRPQLLTKHLMFIICLECGLGTNLTENQTQYTFHIASNRLQNLLKRRIFFYVSKTMFIFP